MQNRIILDLCGGTGSWSKPYREAGYDVRLVTLPEIDVRNYEPPPRGDVHGILAAPPCTEFAASGARWWANKDPRLLEDALATFDACLRIIRTIEPVWWALENPRGRLRKLRPELGPPRLVFHPCDYGDPYTKETFLWGRFEVPKRAPVPPENPRPGSSFIHRLPPSNPDRAMLRSKTPDGFARAFFEANP